MKFYITIIISIILASCGNKNSGDGKAIITNETLSEDSLDGSSIQGLYLATFQTLNPSINGFIPGSLTIERKNDQLLVYARLFAGQVGAWHPQGIYLGRRCPALSDDKNGDGLIDIQEAMLVVGKMIIPLDANLNSQHAGYHLYPVGDLMGSYFYERATSFSNLFKDLRKVESDPKVDITKLSSEEKFGLLGRVIMVQGISSTTTLPETVSGLGEKKGYQTFPITCGIIRKFPARSWPEYNGTIPGPIAQVEIGQDHPEPGPVHFPGRIVIDPTETTGGTTTGDTTGGTTTGETTGGTTTGETTGGTTTGETTGGTTTGDTTGGTTTGETTGGTTTGDTTGGTTTGETTGGTTTGDTTGGTTTGETTGGTTTGETTGGTIPN